MQEGRVKWFSESKGFGFIVPEDSENEILVHFSAIESRGFKTLSEGELVLFEAGTDSRGKLTAVRVLPQQERDGMGRVINRAAG